MFFLFSVLDNEQEKVLVLCSLILACKIHVYRDGQMKKKLLGLRASALLKLLVLQKIYLPFKNNKTILLEKNNEH